MSSTSNQDPKTPTEGNVNASMMALLLAATRRHSFNLGHDLTVAELIRELGGDSGNFQQDLGQESCSQGQQARRSQSPSLPQQPIIPLVDYSDDEEAGDKLPLTPLGQEQRHIISPIDHDPYEDKQSQHMSSSPSGQSPLPPRQLTMPLVEYSDDEETDGSDDQTPSPSPPPRPQSQLPPTPRTQPLQRSQSRPVVDYSDTDSNQDDEELEKQDEVEDDRPTWVIDTQPSRPNPHTWLQRPPGKRQRRREAVLEVAQLQPNNAEAQAAAEAERDRRRRRREKKKRQKKGRADKKRFDRDEKKGDGRDRDGEADRVAV